MRTSCYSKKQHQNFKSRVLCPRLFIKLHVKGRHGPNRYLVLPLQLVLTFIDRHVKPVCKIAATRANAIVLSLAVLKDSLANYQLATESTSTRDFWRQCNAHCEAMLIWRSFRLACHESCASQLPSLACLSASNSRCCLILSQATIVTRPQPHMVQTPA